MGSISKIFKPEDWKKELEGKSKILENDIIYKMVIGSCEDYVYYEITEFISKINYGNIINKKYKIEIFPYAKLPILLFDEENNLIPLVKGNELLLENLNTSQITYLENHNTNFTKKLIKK